MNECNDLKLVKGKAFLHLTSQRHERTSLADDDDWQKCCYIDHHGLLNIQALKQVGYHHPEEKARGGSKEGDDHRGGAGPLKKLITSPLFLLVHDCMIVMIEEDKENRSLR